MITDNYIKMCEQAEEIQRLLNEPRSAKEWKHSYYVEKWEKRNYNDIEYIDFCGENLLGRKIIWLPTLEQLFEMVGKYKAQISRVFLSIMIMKKYKFESIQELVLNAVMEIKYSKTWTGEKWEAI